MRYIPILVFLSLSMAYCGDAGKEPQPRNDAGQNAAADSLPQAWVNLYDNRNRLAWRVRNPGSWTLENGVLERSGNGDIWTLHPYDDFRLECEFKIGEEARSGIFFRTEDINDMLQTGLELQITGSYGVAHPGKNDCGALCDLQAPRTNALAEQGEWNRLLLICSGKLVTVEMNGERIIEADLAWWDRAGYNPDGSRNRYRRPVAELVPSGYIGFQDEGHPVWYRNVRITAL